MQIAQCLVKLLEELSWELLLRLVQTPTVSISPFTVPGGLLVHGINGDGIHLVLQRQVRAMGIRVRVEDLAFLPP